MILAGGFCCCEGRSASQAGPGWPELVRKPQVQWCKRRKQGLCSPKPQLGANSDYKAMYTLSPVNLATYLDMCMHFLSFLKTTGKMKGNKGSSFPPPAARLCFAAGCPTGPAVRLLILMCR